MPRIANLEAARRQADRRDEPGGGRVGRAQGRRCPARRRRARRSEPPRLQLGYTVITAPIAGIVARRRVEPGELVQPGQTLLSIVPSDATCGSRRT